jgi:hypothetical protein
MSDVGPDAFEVEDAADARDSSDASTTPASRYRDAVMADHPLVYLRLGDAKGSSSAHDELDKFNGSYSDGGITFGTPGALLGDPDPAITFTDGTGQIVMPGAVAFGFDGQKAFSVELWVKPLQVGGQYYLVDHATLAGGERAGWLLLGGRAGGATFVRFENTSTADQAGGAAPMTQERWYHLVATYDSATAFLYLDAVLIGQKASSVALPLPVAGATFSVGNQNCACEVGNAFRGDMDEVAIYDTALSLERIQPHYDAARK